MEKINIHIFNNEVEAIKFLILCHDVMANAIDTHTTEQCPLTHEKIYINTGNTDVPQKYVGELEIHRDDINIEHKLFTHYDTDYQDLINIYSIGKWKQI